MNALLERLGMGEISSLFDSCVEQAEKLPDTPQWLTEHYITALNEQTGALEKRLEDVLQALPLVRENKDLVWFAKTLYLMLPIRKDSEDIFDTMAFPKAPEGENPLPYDMMAIFPIIGRLQAGYEDLKARGIDKEILSRTYSKCLDGSIDASSARTGRMSFNFAYFHWCSLYTNGRLLEIGRLNFEIIKATRLNMWGLQNAQGEVKLLVNRQMIHSSGWFVGSPGCPEDVDSFLAEFSETEDTYRGYAVDPAACRIEKNCSILPKSQWKIFLRPDDWVVNVHIPKEGALTEESCMDAYEKAREIYRKFFPEYRFPVFVCESWLLSPQLKQLLKPDSNILRFQSKYLCFPMVSCGLDVFSFAYTRAVDSLDHLDLESLPEDTSLQRNVKAFYQNGGIVHEGSGLFLF